MVCPCCVQGPQCCCDENGIRLLAANEACSGSQFPQPNPQKTVSLFFEWCGMTTLPIYSGGVSYWYRSNLVDFKVCDTTGRYGEEESYTQATSKTISVTPSSVTAGLGGCGYAAQFLVGVEFLGVGMKKLGDGSFVGIENVVTTELYDCHASICFDGSEVEYTMELYNFTEDDTCGGSGCFDPCKFSTPTLTIVVAP